MSLCRRGCSSMLTSSSKLLDTNGMVNNPAALLSSTSSDFSDMALLVCTHSGHVPGMLSPMLSPAYLPESPCAHCVTARHPWYCLLTWEGGKGRFCTGNSCSYIRWQSRSVRRQGVTRVRAASCCALYPAIRFAVHPSTVQVILLEDYLMSSPNYNKPLQTSGTGVAASMIETELGALQEQRLTQMRDSVALKAILLHYVGFEHHDQPVEQVA